MFAKRGLLFVGMLCAARAFSEPASIPVRSGAEVDYPPFSFIDSGGAPVGFSIELFREALAAMGREAVFQTGYWHDIKGGLARGELDALPLVGRTPERERLFDFTFPYMSLHGAIVVRAGTRGVGTLSDLSGRRVAVMRADNAEEFLRREDRDFEIIPTASFEEALNGLSRGDYDAVVVQRLVAIRLIDELGLDNLHAIGRPIEGFRQDFCFAVQKGDAVTLVLLNEGLALVMADGTFRRLHAKWFAALELPAKRRIVVGGDHAYPPFEFLDAHGNPAGFNVDLTRAIARDLGLQIEIRLGPWTEILEQLASGEIDALQGLLYTPERSMLFDFSPAHTVMHYVAVTRKNTFDPPAKPEELSGLSVAVQSGDVAHDWLEQSDIQATHVLLETQRGVLQAVLDGDVECGLASRRLVLRLTREEGLKNLKVGRQHLFAFDYGYAVRSGDQALLAKFSEGLDVLRASGEVRRIARKWFGGSDAGTADWHLILRYSARFLVPLLLLLLLAVSWSAVLRRQVRRRTEALRESEAYIRTILDNLPLGIAVNSVDPQVAFEYMNDRFPSIYGTTREALAEPGAFWPAVYQDPVFRERIRKRVLADCASGDPSRMRWESIPVVRRGAKTRYIDAQNIPVPNRSLMISTVADATERHRAQERILHLNRVLRTIRDVNQLIVRERDRSGLIRKACRLMVEHQGYHSALIILVDDRGAPFLWAAEGTAASCQPLEERLKGGVLPPCCHLMGAHSQPLRVGDRVGVCGDCPLASLCESDRSLCVRLAHDGQRFGYLLVALEREVDFETEEGELFNELADDLGYALHGLQTEDARDESEKSREVLLTQLAQAQKLEAVGRLAGGVAHDFNNLIMGIMGYADMCRAALEADHPVIEWVDEITSAAQRSANLTRQLLAFARCQPVAPRVLDLNETIDSMLKLLRRLLGEDVDLVWMPASEVWPVEMDPSQVDQILANLCVNARDAIDGVGKLTIETGNETFNLAYCAENAGAVPGDFVMLAVSDDGCGMSGEVLEHVFEPFFTTKERGKGTGLGLATIYGIVKQNGGFINVYSEPGKGSTFRIYLPRASIDTAEAALDSEPDAAKPPGGGETLLLVEDDPNIRMILERSLGSLGYRLLSAGSPAEALRIAGVPGTAFDLLITDVVMSGMNGCELVERLSHDRPGLKCLYMSGYTANVIVHHGVLDKGVEYIQKPVSLHKLALRIRSILDA